MSIVNISPEVSNNASETQIFHSSYRYQQVIPQSGSQSVTLSATSTVDTVFQIPVTHMNLSRSKIIFDVLSQVETNQSVHIHALGSQPFERATLSLRSGETIVDLPMCNQFLNVTTLPCTSFLDAYTSNGSDGTIAETLATVVSTYNGLAGADRSNRTVAGVDNKAMAIRYSIDLNRFHETLLSLDQSLYFGQTLTLRLTWALSGKIFFKSDDATQTYAGTAALAAIPAITSLRLLLATEVNPDVIAKLNSEIMSDTGIHVKIPYVYSLRQVGTSTTSSSVTHRLSRMDGARLMRVYVNLNNATETLDTCFKRLPTTSTGSWKDIRVQINGQYLTDNAISFNDCDALIYMSDQLKGSCVQDNAIFDKVAFWMENFCAAKPYEKSKLSLQDGLSLDIDRNVSIAINTQSSTSFVMYVHYVCQRDLFIKANNAWLL